MEQVNHSGTSEKRCAHETNASLQSFKQFYLEHFSFVLRNAQRFGIQPEEAEDVAQDVFITAYRLRHSLRKNVSGKAWLYGITRRVAAGRRRTRNRRTRKLEALAKSKSSISTLNFSDQFHAGQLVEHLLGQIDKEKQEVFVLAELFDMSGQEIADALGIKVSTGASRLRLARAKFRELVAQYEPEQTTVAQASLLRHARAQQRVSNSKTFRSWTVFVAAIMTPAAPACSAAAVLASHSKLAPIWHLSVSLTATFTLLWGIGTALQAPAGAGTSDLRSTSAGCSASKIFGNTPPPDPAKISKAPSPKFMSKMKPEKLLMRREKTSDSSSRTSKIFEESHYDTNLITNNKGESSKNGMPTVRSNDIQKQESPTDQPENDENSGTFLGSATQQDGLPQNGDSTPPSPESDEIPSHILSACSEYCNDLDACRPPWGDCSDRCIGRYKSAVASDSACEEPFLALHECVHESTCSEIKDYINETDQSYPCQSQEIELKTCRGIPVDLIAKKDKEQLLPGL